MFIHITISLRHSKLGSCIVSTEKEVEDDCGTTPLAVMIGQTALFLAQQLTKAFLTAQTAKKWPFEMRVYPSKPALRPANNTPKGN